MEGIPKEIDILGNHERTSPHNPHELIDDDNDDDVPNTTVGSGHNATPTATTTAAVYIFFQLAHFRFLSPHPF
jgi:hypothetical protein